jgi:hypothetical protein
MRVEGFSERRAGLRFFGQIDERSGEGLGWKGGMVMGVLAGCGSPD